MTLLLVLLSVGCSDSPPPGEKVVEFARSKLGQKVGDGQCTALVSEALRHAGARPPRREHDTWGEELKSLASARPGDILVFENVVIAQRKPLPGGNVARLTLRSAHHAAIVATVAGRGKDARLTILHQNSGFDGSDESERKVVQQWTFSSAELKKGTIKAYRPVASDPPHHVEPHS